MSKTDLVVATKKIDGTILPGTPFHPKDAAQHDELVKLEAIREPTEAESALFEKHHAARKPKADAKAEAAAAAEAAKAAAAAADDKKPATDPLLG